jgi:hypothetical protein
MVEELVQRWERVSAGGEHGAAVSGYFAGLDLGQAHDYTALAVVEAAETRGEWDAAQYCHKRNRELRLRHLERMALGQPYPAMVARTAHVMRSGALSGAARYLAVDATGVGRPVVDLLRERKPACTLWPAVITGGHAEGYADGFYRVPKRELLVGLQVMLQSGGLRIAADVPEAKSLVRELSAMRVEVNEAGREGWRSGAHDDLVFAVALACWAAKKGRGALREWW